MVVPSPGVESLVDATGDTDLGGSDTKGKVVLSVVKYVGEVVPGVVEKIVVEVRIVVSTQ